eukprot:12082849-Heterocapsa_arctica.AAC.1
MAAQATGGTPQAPTPGTQAPPPNPAVETTVPQPEDQPAQQPTLEPLPAPAPPTGNPRPKGMGRAQSKPPQNTIYGKNKG